MLAWRRWLPPRAKRRRLALASPLVAWRACNSVVDRITSASTLVVGAGYSLQERKRLEKQFGAYAALGSDSGPPSQMHQLEEFELPNEIGAAAMVHNILLVRKNKKFQQIVIDRCVFGGFCYRQIPHREYGRNKQGELNGCTELVFNADSYGMRAVQDALVTDGTLFICNDGGEEQLEQRIADVRKLRSDIKIKTFEPEL